MMNLPSVRRLLLVWVLLVAFTLVSMFSAQLDRSNVWQALPLWAAILVLVSTGFKVHLILMNYLNLRVSSAAWKGAFSGLLIATLVIILAGYLAARYDLIIRL